jgi:HSP20 family protein
MEVEEMKLGSIIPWREKTQVPVVRRDDVYDPFVAFRQEIDRLFDDVFASFGGRSAFASGNGWQAVTPTIDVADGDKELVVTAELPGLDQKDFEVTLSGDLLTIKGEKKAEHEQHDGDAYYKERRFGAFSRSIRLPFAVGDEAVDARYDKGVLTVRVPKPAEAQRLVRHIDVKAG